MTKNVPRIEQGVRIGLGIIFGLLACLVTSWSGCTRIVLGIVAVSFLGTALVGY